VLHWHPLHHDTNVSHAADADTDAAAPENATGFHAEPG
jgi:hypothetical protein